MPYKQVISGVYKIQSRTKPERIYIGSACNIYQRWTYHRSDFSKGKHSSPQFQRHVNKYGLSDLEFSIIAICSIDELMPDKEHGGTIWIEQSFIIAYRYNDTDKPYFNASPHAGSPKGTVYTAEMRENMSRGQKGKKRITPMTDEEHAKRSMAMMGNTRGRGTKGLKRTEEQKRKQSEMRKGKKAPPHVIKAMMEGVQRRKERLRKEKEEYLRLNPPPPKQPRRLTEEHKRKISESQIGKIITDEMKENMRKSHLGKKQSKETKDKRSVIMKKIWETRDKTPLRGSPRDEKGRFLKKK